MVNSRAALLVLSLWLFGSVAFAQACVDERVCCLEQQIRSLRLEYEAFLARAASDEETADRVWWRHEDLARTLYWRAERERRRAREIHCELERLAAERRALLRNTTRSDLARNPTSR